MDKPPLEDNPTFGGYTLDDLLRICKLRGQRTLETEDIYVKAAQAALPFLVARLRQELDVDGR